MSGLLAAVAFLTRVPVRVPSEAIATSLAWFPVVGAAVGGLAAIGLLAAAWLWPSPLPALAAVAVAVAATGGFHEDGLADTADAFAAGGDLERRLRVMDDPRIGAVGAVVLVLVLLGRVAALALLPLAAAAAALVAAHTLARWAVPALLWRLPYVRGEAGIAARLKRGATGARLAAATALALAVVVAAAALAAALPLPAGLSGPPVGTVAGAVATDDTAATAGAAAAADAAATAGVAATGDAAAANVAGIVRAAATAAAAVAAALLVTLAAGALFRRRFGGVTGDLLGAACQAVELAVYLAVLAVVHRGG